MKIYFIGGALEIGGSCILIHVEGKNILLDCGLRQGGGKDPLPDFRSIQEAGGVDAIIVSHAHLDHTGTLPVISKEYPGAAVFMNTMTRDLVRVLLYDSLKIMNFNEGEVPLYAEADVEGLFSRIKIVNFHVETEFLEGMFFTFYNAGHIAGASAVYLKTPGGTLFYSGDFSLFPQKTVTGMKIPKLRPDIAIIESTYGDKLHSNREVEENHLIEAVEALEKEEGKMLIPAFALGRSQEVIQILKKAKNKGRLGKIPVYIDGMVRNINGVYKRNPLFLQNSLAKRIFRGIDPFYDNTIKPVRNNEERQQLLSGKGGCIIVSSSGMLMGGPSQFYAGKIASLENGVILITGYQDEEAPGRRLLNLLEAPPEERVLTIDGTSIPLRCRIGRIGLSAHGDKNEIHSLLNLLSPRHLFLVHGERKVIEGLGKGLAAEHRGRVYAPACGESFEIHVHNPRKQLTRELPLRMNRTGELSEETLEELWEFCRTHYPDRLHTIEDLTFIWSGKKRYDNIRDIQNLIIGSPYFQCDIRRLFLLKAESPESVAEELAEKEPNQQDVMKLAEEMFLEYGYKKVSLMLDEKRIILGFDFPGTVGNSVLELFKVFTEQTGWDIEINKTINLNASENLVRSLLKGCSIRKISHYLEENFVQVIVSGDCVVGDAKEVFAEKTGLDLEIEAASGLPAAPLPIIPDGEMVEQNAALSFIDDAFTEEEFRPYKKSIKSDGDGKYIELSFISPRVGRRFNVKMEDIAGRTGWRIVLGNSVNQNVIMNLAKRLCEECGVHLKKNPSYNPRECSVTLKPEPVDPAKLEELREDFTYRTGCDLLW